MLPSQQIQAMMSLSKFIGLTTDTILSLKNHTDQFTSKLSTAYYVIRAVKTFVSQETLRMIYFSRVHSIMIYSAILRGIHLIAEIFLRFKK